MFIEDLRRELEKMKSSNNDALDHIDTLNQEILTLRRNLDAVTHQNDEVKINIL